MFFRRLVPKVRQIKMTTGSIWSFRWTSFGCDVFNSQKGFFLVQYGRRGKPLRYICRIGSKVEKPPLFLLSDNWSRIFQSKTLVAGETTKPLSLAKLWGV